MFLKIVLAVVAAVLLLAIYAAFKPADYVITREVAINAPVEKIFPYLNTPKLADQWGPWAEVDPQAQMVHTGPEVGVGSKTSWDSPGRLGTGSATIVESVPNERVAIKLEYTKPMNMSQDATYLVRASGGQSIVTWRVEGKNTFMGRFMCTFFNMDKMVGGMFEKGLSKLKGLMERSSAT